MLPIDFKKSKLAKKITFRLLFIESIVFSIMIILILVIILPATKSSSINKCDLAASSIANQFDSQISYFSPFIDSVTSSETIINSITRYNIDNENRLSNQAKININLNEFSSSNALVRHIVIQSNDNTYFSSITQTSAADATIFSTDSFTQLINGHKSTWLSPIYSQQKADGSFLYSIAYSKMASINGQNYIVTIFSDITTSLTYFSPIISEYFDKFVIYDMYGNLIFQTIEETDFTPIQNSDDLANYVQSLSENSSDFFSYKHGRNNFCSVIGYTTTETLHSNFLYYIIITIIIFVVIFITTILTINPIIARQLKPLISLYSSIISYTNGNLQVRADFMSNDEIGELSKLYNNMLDKIDSNTKSLVQKEQEKNKIKFSLIASQIDPHFIFNTMNIITTLARQKKNNDIINLNTALIKLLQDRLRISPTEIFDSIEHEIYITKEYIKIIQYRTQMQVVFNWIYDDSILHISIPKNILQPIIENSLFHGLYDAHTGNISGKITIEIKLSNNCISITIKDNGKGISVEALEAFYSSSSHSSSAERGQHIGLKNIKDRLSYIYDNSDIINIGNLNPNGVVVYIILKVQ